MTPEQLLAEVEDLLRTMPQAVRQGSPESFAWRGRATALVKAWDPVTSIGFSIYTADLFSGPAANINFSKMMVMLNQMRFDLQMKVKGPLSSVIDHGQVFDYFDEVRKIIEPTQQDIFFVDPYLDAEFVSRYLPHVRPGTAVRLLTREKLTTLMPAVRTFALQTQMSVAVRSAPGFHDRYVFVDRTSCYQSGASFKDGGRAAPTTLTQITDAFPAMLQTYETLWSTAKLEA